MWEERALPAAREKRVKNGRRRLHRIAGSCGERRGKKSGCGVSYRPPLELSASLEENPNAYRAKNRFAENTDSWPIPDDGI